MEETSYSSTMSSPVYLTQSIVIPTDEDFDCRDTRFFQTHGQLPAPSEVRAQAQAQYSRGESLDKRKNFDWTHMKPPASFASMKLFVKWGAGVRFHEFQTLYALNRVYNGAIQVPEVYGWRVDGYERFLYMELLEGETMEKAWDSLRTDERVSLCSQLRGIVNSIRQLRQDPQDIFIGTVGRTCLYDRGISMAYRHEAGPFSSVKELHDWFAFCFRRPFPNQASIPLEPFRHDLPDDAPIRLTHGDLHRSNIIISLAEPRRILALVDWEQSGWLPEYWEDCKAHLTTRRCEWATTYLPLILDNDAKIREAWDYYSSSMGPV